MNSNGKDASIPYLRMEMDRMQASCDARHGDYSVRLSRLERRSQLLFGDDDSRTPGILGQIREGQSENKAIAISVKKKVTGLEIKLAGIVAVLQIVMAVAMHFITK